jgi:hypothetical protein
VRGIPGERTGFPTRQTSQENGALVFTSDRSLVLRNVTCEPVGPSTSQPGLLP